MVPGPEHHGPSAFGETTRCLPRTNSPPQADWTPTWPGSFCWRSWSRLVGKGYCRRNTSVWIGSACGGLEAWASVKSFRPKDEDPPPSEGGGRDAEVDFRGERRSNDTHRFTTDPEARLARKGQGKEAKLCCSAHVLMEIGRAWWWTCASLRRMVHRNGRRRWQCCQKCLGTDASPWAPTVLRHSGLCQGMPEVSGNASRGPEAALGH